MIARFLLVFAICIGPVWISHAQDKSEPSYSLHTEELHETAEAGHAHEPSPWSTIPFALLLIMIATGPIFYEHFWHHHYPKVALGLAALTVTYYLFILDNTHEPVHAFFEYFQFIALLAALFVAAGGIMIQIDKEGKPLINTMLLLVGAVVANIIGTTGASMLLIRPFIRLNSRRIQPYHIVFFILMVSNVGGCLTPIGDPPLFLGFLKGVPFDWNLYHNFLPWLTAILILGMIFYIYDTRFSKENPIFVQEEDPVYSNRVSIVGSRNFLLLALIIACVFLDPAKISWVPGIIISEEYGVSIQTIASVPDTYGDHYTAFSFIRELLMLVLGFVSYRFANKRAILGNEFNFEPIREVAFIFIGIFGTMMPALELVGAFAASPEGAELINPNTLYWGTGLISGFLDNAPTYLNFFTAALAAKGGSINNAADVTAFAYGEGDFAGTTIYLVAISVAAVFFGALTYIGNGPNFMVKSIAEQIGIQMPSFFGYIVRYTVPILVPVLVIIWLLFIFSAT